MASCDSIITLTLNASQPSYATGLNWKDDNVKSVDTVGIGNALEWKGHK